MSQGFIAVDWGTTNRRAYLIEDGAVVRTERDDRGVSALKAGDYPGEVAALRVQLGDLPILLAGMVGSSIGWRVVPYVAAPAGIDALAAGVLRIDPRTAIIPGVSLVDGPRADVMRGEEVQLLGSVAVGLVPPDALLVQPGTHCKWVLMRKGQIADFTTVMTGELFALLRRHSILGPQLDDKVAVDAAFRQGVEDAKRGDLLAALFQIRAAKLMGLRDDADAASYCSGLLIGTDVAARLATTDHVDVHLLADPKLGALYAAAIDAHGRRPHFVDSHAAFVAGIIQLGNILA